MGFFDFLKPADINAGVEKFKSTGGAVLLDVRTPAEYKSGHIPGSRNFPLDSIETLPQVIADKNIPIFVHCFSGARSGQAASAMRRMGYTNVTNIGGISGYRGKVVK